MGLLNIGDSEKLHECWPEGWITEDPLDVRRTNLANRELGLLRHEGHRNESNILAAARDAFSRLGCGFHGSA